MGRGPGGLHVEIMTKALRHKLRLELRDTESEVLLQGVLYTPFIAYTLASLGTLDAEGLGTVKVGFKTWLQGGFSHGF
jgi:hypothetical protein